MTATTIDRRQPRCRPHPLISAARPGCPGQPDRAEQREPRSGALDRPAARSYPDHVPSLPTPDEPRTWLRNTRPDLGKRLRYTSPGRLWGTQAGGLMWHCARPGAARFGQRRAVSQESRCCRVPAVAVAGPHALVAWADGATVRVVRANGLTLAKAIGLGRQHTDHGGLDVAIGADGTGVVAWREERAHYRWRMHGGVCAARRGASGSAAGRGGPDARSGQF